MKKITTALMALSFLLLSACGSSYDREDFVSELMESDIDRPTAECVADGVEAQIGEDRLNDRGDLTAEENEILVDITFECVLGG